MDLRVEAEAERVAEGEADHITQASLSPPSYIIPTPSFPLVEVYPYYLKQWTYFQRIYEPS